MEEPTTGAFSSLEDVFGGEVVQAVKEMVGGASLGISNGPGRAGRPEQVRPAARFGPGL